MSNSVHLIQNCLESSHEIRLTNRHRPESSIGGKFAQASEHVYCCSRDYDLQSSVRVWRFLCCQRLAFVHVFRLFCAFLIFIWISFILSKWVLLTLRESGLMKKWWAWFISMKNMSFCGMLRHKNYRNCDKKENEILKLLCIFQQQLIYESGTNSEFIPSVRPVPHPTLLFFHFPLFGNFVGDIKNKGLPRFHFRLKWNYN